MIKVANSPAPEPFMIRTVDELNNQGMKLITKLNHDCLAKVFMHLSILERLEMEKVCKKWKEAVDLSWYNVKKLELSELMITLDKKKKILEMLMIKCGRFLSHLTIIDDQYPWMSSVLKENCKNIINFSINMEIVNNNNNKWKILSEDLVEIIGSMQKLKYLKVEMNPYQSYDVARKIVDKLPKDIHEIHLIDRKQCGLQINKKTPVLKRFKSLQCLTLYRFSLTNETLEGILENKDTLTKLNLSECIFPLNGIPIFKYLNNLEEIILNGVDKLDVIQVTSIIAHNCLKLKHFELMNYSQLDVPRVPFNIYRKLKYLNLEYLSIYNVDRFDNRYEPLLPDMTNNWKQLKYLDINTCYGFFTHDLDEIKKLTNLQHFNLRELSRMELSEASIIIANNCHELKELIMETKNLSKAAIFELANLKKLEKLNISENDNLNDYLLERIVNNCKNLVELYVCNCKNITEASLIQIGKLKNLKLLALDGNKYVSNAMFDNFKKLEWLSCNNCPRLTDEGVIKVLDNCQKLSFLNLEKTGITVESLVHASKRKFVFKFLKIKVDSHVKNKYERIVRKNTPSPYLIILFDKGSFWHCNNHYY